MPRFVAPHLVSNLAKIAEFEAVVSELGCTPAQLALAWLLAKGDHIVPIPGTTRLEHLKENLGAAHIVLALETVRTLDEILPANALEGPRYTAAAQAQIDTELLPGEAVDGPVRPATH
jgi:hypothetical protein